MKPISKAALVAFTAASIGATSLAPAFAQPFGGGQHVIQRVPGGEARSFRPGPVPGFGMHGGLFGMFLSGNAESIDVAAVRLTHRLDLTEDQQTLLEDLRLAALDAQAEIITAREEFAPAADEAMSDTDLIARYAGLVAMTTARADALEAIQPAFEAFVSSLDDTQLESLVPQRPDWAPERSAPAASEAEG
ncbi:Spy/CpxP family protein refolding chaperone [Pelagibacterium sp. 26DY04]|uniref:Spy/CpxP family protein refolding chaperone n=1 Tax=Pelagibacterium sp. 26DY04 TaxID=2967130 RepID=UPI002815F50E|nr:Spy/CpxP family protein refolding chaperone [Pelagibacterium sp. 26DY04]WMT85316.1 Spy/CpxP family protein refolding chaperone [Pelagibacterium sp. 26DY04]